MKQRLLVVMLTVTLVLSFIPTLAFAGDETEEEIPAIEKEATETIETEEQKQDNFIQDEEETNGIDVKDSNVDALQEDRDIPSETEALELNAGTQQKSISEEKAQGTKAAAKDDVRICGSTRYETAIEVADEYKATTGAKFENVVVAYGKNFPDALSGGYLAKVKNAPILLVEPSVENRIADYISRNIASGGIVYILGGTGVVSTSFEDKLETKGIETNRLGGQNRYETNLEILKEAGVSNQEILVCTGGGYADSLSASAAGKPILLVGNTLTDAQKEYVRGLSISKFYLIGGTGVVIPATETELRSLGYNVERLAGGTRYDTSTAVARKFFPSTEAVMLAYAKNFPDGLSGGPFAMKKNAPIILTDSNKTTAAKEYVRVSGATKSITLGGPTLISDAAVQEIMGRISNPAAIRIYNYVAKNGYSVNSNYRVSGNRCIESAGPSNTNYIISVDTNDNTKIYFSMFKTKPAPGRYKDTTETTSLCYNINNSFGDVHFSQFYYTSSSYSSFTYYFISGKLTYANYIGASYYKNETGITDISKSGNPVEVGSYESQFLIDPTQEMITNIDRMLYQYFNLRFRNLGFSKL